MQKDDLNVIKTWSIILFLLWLSEDLSIGQILSEKSMGVRG